MCIRDSFIIVVLNGQLAAGHISFAVYGLVVFKGGVCTTTREFVVAIQLNRGIAAAGHAHGGLAASSLDVHILERDLDLIVLIFGLDGHGVLIRRAGDDGAGVAVGGLIVLGDVVAGLACRNRNVTIFDVPCPCLLYTSRCV